MADIADLANDRAELILQHALARAVGKSAPESHPAFDGAGCVDCAEAIPPARLALGKVRCVPCQELLERARRLGLA